MEGAAPDNSYEGDLTPLKLPGRHPRMPSLFEARSHPLHPTSNPGKSYVYYTRPTEAGMQERLQAGEAMPVEGMSEADLASAGFLRLLHGDYVFTRNELGNRDPKDDVAVCYVLGPKLRSKEKMSALDSARKKFIGPAEEITEDSVRFERLKPKPRPVKEGTRCWALGTILEPNTNIEAPCANGKTNEGEREYHAIVHDVVVASTSLAMEDIAQAPEGIQEVLRSEFERHGGAPLGCEENFAYHAVQCNLAYAGKSMEAQMGRYAGIHRDERDCPGHYSTMITRSQLPPNYVPPRMILPGLGLYTDMNDFVGFTFQARHEHVGSPAYPRPGTQPSSTAYRFALIHYTPERVASGDTRLRIGALPTTPTFLAPEMRSSKAEKNLIRALQEDSFANFLRDGHCIIADGGFAPFVGRVTYQVVRYLLKQTHGRFEFEVDPALFASSITYKSSDGTRLSVPEWEMAPTVQGNQDNEREVKREESEKRFKEHLFKHGSMILSSFNHNEWMKEEAAKRYGPIVRTERIRGGNSTTSRAAEANKSSERDKRLTRSHLKSSISTRDVSEAGESRIYNTRKRKRETEEVERDEEEGEEDEEEEGEYDEDLAQHEQQGGWKGLLQNESHHAGGGARFRKRSRKTEHAQDEKSFKLLQMLTVDALEEEILGLRRELQAEEKWGSVEIDVDEIKENIDGANEAVERGGVGKRALGGIQAILQDAHRLSAHIKLSSGRLRGFRQSLIKAETSLRCWIEGPVAEEAYKAVMKGRSGGAGVNQSWVSKLANQVVEMLVSKKATHVFRAADYGLKWGKAIELENRHTAKNMLRGQDGTINAAVEMTVSVVEGWADADELCDKKQAWFASVVEEVMGEEALTLDIIWNLYQNVRPAHIMLGDKGYRNPTRSDVEQFRSALENHSIMDRDHREGQLFNLYKQLLSQELSPSDIVKSLPSVSSKWLALQEMIRLAAIFDDEGEPEGSSPYFEKLKADPRMYHPLRERSHARVKCRDDLMGVPGPISQEAIFSLLAWRAYPQVFSWHPDSTMLYSSPGEFLDAYETILKTEPPEKTCKAVERFWLSLRERRWTQFADTYPTFDQCYQHFRPNGSLETRLYPGLSRTDAFDVACDLTYAGFCQPPTTADVARYIVHMNQGAMAGMKVLGLMDNKKMDVEVKRRKVHQALLDVGELLKSVPEYASYEEEIANGLGLELYRDGEMDPMGLEFLLRTLSHGIKHLL